MSRRFLAVLVVAALAAALLGGLAGRDDRDGAPVGRERAAPAPAPPADPAAAIAALLRERAAAFAGHDARAFAATATGAQRSRDRRAVARSRRVPFARAAYEVESLAIDGDRARLTGSETTRLRGIDGRQAVPVRIALGRDGSGDWRVRRVAYGRKRPPWALAGQAVRRTARFTILYPRGTRLLDLPQQLEQGRRTVRRALPGRLGRRERLLALVAADARQARSLTADIAGVGTLAAITDAEVRERPGPERAPAAVVGARLLVVLPAYTELDADGRATVVTHELTHVALAGATSGRTPAWLQEGLALLVSGDRRVDEAAFLLRETVIEPAAGARAARVRRALRLSSLSAPDAIARLSGDAQGAAYAYSSSAAAYIAERWSTDRLRRLYDVFLDPGITGARTVDVVDAAVREVLGLSLARLERDLRRWIVTRALVAPQSP